MSIKLKIIFFKFFIALKECKNKPCGEPCIRGICDGNGFCVDRLSNPCSDLHGCDDKKCGDICLRDGDILGFCDKDLNCDYSRKPCGI